eukprot:TRINITY_DN3901_c0_g1_i3.p1 TRINITY_DN3901_c0_g1~~TRINITY_DN3901_c0_g1_i3.p1  ORF type:complete len:392 (-),score=63.03 TRINITY_DN3901_c0_g1_i3:157-1272(-)
MCIRDRVRPLLTTESLFMIREGRHLLTEIVAGDSFIPNDYFVYNFEDSEEEEFDTTATEIIHKNHSNKCAVLTGANFSGKSVYLKQVGLVAFLAHIGSFVPAKLCKIGLFDSILTLIHATDSMSATEIGYAQELQELSKIMAVATNRSLVLIDELGKNSLFEDGVALLASTVLHFSSNKDFMINKALTPKISASAPSEDNPSGIIMKSKNLPLKQLYDRLPTSIIITHYKEIFSHNLVQENYLIRFLTTDFLLSKEKKFIALVKDPESLAYKARGNLTLMKMEDLASLEADEKRMIVYLYKIKPGFALSSFALECARSIVHEPLFVQRSVHVLNSFLKRQRPEALEHVRSNFKQNVAKVLEQLGSVLHQSL